MMFACQPNPSFVITILNASQPQGYSISTPGFPGYYDSYLSCVWKIIGTPYKRIHLIIDDSQTNEIEEK